MLQVTLHNGIKNHIGLPSGYLKNTSTITSALKKEEVSREVATFNMGHILDCANVMCFDDNSKSFEEALKSADEPEEIIALFNQVTLRKL